MTGEHRGFVMDHEREEMKELLDVSNQGISAYGRRT